MNHVNNDDIHQGPKTVSGDKDIHLSSSVRRKKVGDLSLNMCSTLQTNNYDNIPKCIGGVLYVHSYRAPKQMGT
jgi:hypothetical protein